MKIIIVGAGQVGGTLAENLAREYNDITLIDINEHALRSLQDRLDIRTVVGTGCCLLYTSPSPRDRSLSRMPSSA